MQDSLRNRVQMILELLGELTGEFGVLIIDHGSVDESRDVALDLVREFPQVDFLDGSGQVDLLAVIETGIHRTRGEIIFIHDPSLPLASSALHSLWQMRADDDLVMAQSRSRTNARRSFLDLPSGRGVPAAGQSSVQMIRRRAMRDLPQAAQRSTAAVDRVTRTDLLDQPADALRLPKLLARLRRYTTY